MIRAVIFDCFGVLVSEAWRQFYEEHVRTDAARQQARDIQKALDTGMLSEQEFVEQIAAIAALTPQQVREYLFSPNKPNRQLLRWIRAHAKQYRLAVLSNISSRERLGEVLEGADIAMFDELVLSGEVGIVKPDARIYHVAAERLGVLPEECIFVDDVERNAQAARQAGMQAITYRNYQHFHQDLNKLLMG